MSADSYDAGLETSGLRERFPKKSSIPQKAKSSETAQETVMVLNTAEEKVNKSEKDETTHGRTPDGTVFTVPHTHDMVSQLLSPTQSKNMSDLIVLAVLAIHFLALYLLPPFLLVPTFAVIFIFWRACYNYNRTTIAPQSHHKRLVAWAKKSKIFETPSTGKNPHPQLYNILKREMETKIPKDYEFERAPDEYNTWLVFRRVVDLILMCDFIS
ncbi:phosphatidylethanolamine N-methyltransferase [Elasticomyces elasticus]|nr:phosphatidylethanolamine N-methyltransferase [Elasticomyces elasticus]